MAETALNRSLSGQRVANYDIKDSIGSGGMAVVYRALQQPLGREVALKVLAPELTRDESVRRRFQLEAQTLAALDHPNILPLFDYGWDGETLYLVMPLVNGGTLKDRLAHGAAPPPVAMRILRDVAEALSHAHRARVIHRDLKPSNVLVHTDGRYLLGDFGLSRGVSPTLELTAHGFTLGTAGYMSPEQAAGEAVDHRADIFSYGVLAYELLTGRQPFLRNSVMETVIASVTDAVPSAAAANPNLPWATDQVLNQILAKRPDERPQTVRQAYRELEAIGLGDTAGVSPAIPTLGTAGHRPVASTPPPPPASRPSQPSPAGGTPALVMLSQLGIERRVPRQAFCSNSHFAACIRTARVVAGAAWPEVVSAMRMPEYLNRDPASTADRATPVEHVSLLEDAMEAVFGSDAPSALREWGRHVYASTPSRRTPMISLPGKKLLSVLRSFANGLDDLRGEPLHAVQAIGDDQYWVAHFGNLHALGRHRSAKSCHFWLGAYEAVLASVGLLNRWRVDEAECGCVTGSYDCVFTIRPATRKLGPLVGTG